MGVKIDKQQLAEIRLLVQAAKRRTEEVEKEPTGRGFWNTLFHYVAIIPVLVDLIGDLVDLLEGD